MINFEVINNYSNIVSKLSIFLFIIAANLVSDIYSCGIRQLVKEYMIIKHIVGFFIMLFFVGLVQEKLDIQSKFSQSILLYIWFIFIMRSPMIITIIAIILICAIYLINLYITDLKNKLEENEELNETNSKQIELFTNINNILFILSFLISVTGTIIYLFILKKHLGKKFNIFNFILGTRDQECFNSTIYQKFKKYPFLFDIKKIIKNKKNLSFT
tara:strand:+ start:1545 stop:2189 length:645 start_codon:yes stop_codon:yes gene_type:complete